jgi:hypothetical protein
VLVGSRSLSFRATLKKLAEAQAKRQIGRYVDGCAASGGKGTRKPIFLAVIFLWICCG